LLLILGWVYQPERVQAGIYLLFYNLLFYNLLASLSLFVGILFVYNSLGSLCLLHYVEMIVWLVVYFISVLVLPFWLGCLFVVHL